MATPPGAGGPFGEGKEEFLSKGRGEKGKGGGGNQQPEKERICRPREKGFPRRGKEKKTKSKCPIQERGRTPS